VIGEEALLGRGATHACSMHASGGSGCEMVQVTALPCS
jgi:hypothetical protein